MQFECSYTRFKNKYRNIMKKCQKISDVILIGLYFISIILDATITLQHISNYGDESHRFTSFMMEHYGIAEGLLRIQGIEALQLAALLGLSYLIVETWRLFKKEDINFEVRLGLIYVYLVIGISKHIHGILSWL